MNKFGVPAIKNLKVVRPTDGELRLLKSPTSLIDSQSFLASIVPLENITWAQAYLTYETDKCRGQGLLRLINEDGKYNKAYTFFSTSTSAYLPES